MAHCKYRVMDKCKKDGMLCTFDVNCFEAEGETAKTNADRIRAMSDEELANFLSNFQEKGGGLTPEMCLEYLLKTEE